MPELTDDQLDRMLEQAAERGAELALRKVGLGDDKAITDVTELREWIRAFRLVKSEALRSFVNIFIKIIILGVLIGLGLAAGVNLKHL